MPWLKIDCKEAAADINKYNKLEHIFSLFVDISVYLPVIVYIQHHVCIYMT